MASLLFKVYAPSAGQKYFESDLLLRMEIGTVLKIVPSERPSFFLRNGGIPLCYVEPKDPTINICAKGWEKTAGLKGYDSLKEFFALREGAKAMSFAIAHETIHQILYELEGENVSLRLDRISGAGEIV